MADAAHGLRRLADLNSPERTRENATPGPATTRMAAPVDPPRTEAVSTQTPPQEGPAHTTPAPSRSRRRGARYAVLGALALLLVIGAVAYAASLRDGGPAHNSANGSSPSGRPSGHASDKPSDKASDKPSATRSPRASSSQAPSGPASRQPAAGTGLGAEKAFLRDYFSKAPGGTDEGWALLTPHYQQQVGRASYDGFWRTIRSVDVGEVRDAGDGAVDAALTYTRTDGSTTTEQHHLTLVRSNGGYLIDGDN
jgi:hypothetical protein